MHGCEPGTVLVAGERRPDGNDAASAAGRANRAAHSTAKGPAPKRRSRALAWCAATIRVSGA